MYNEYDKYSHEGEETYKYNYGGSYESKEPKPKKNGFMKKAALCIVLALLFGVVGGAAFTATTLVGQKITETAEADQVITDQQEIGELIGKADKDTEHSTVTTVYDVSKVVEATMPSLVSITNEGVQEIQSFFGTYRQPSKSSGTGIIVGKNDTELLIATNNHVVDGSEQLNVCFIDNEIVSAVIKGTDPQNDLAVIAVSIENVPTETMKAIAIAELGDSDDLKIGEPVIAIGNALGYGQSVTTGVISALNREVTIQDTTNNLIQTDAAINPGNSGGALLNMYGQVIGINSAKLASSQIEGMGYAIPISTAEPILSDIMSRVTRSRVDQEEQGYLGITGVDVTAEISAQYGIPTGACVASVTDGSAADQAGLQKGDVIVKLDGIKVNSMTSLKDLLGYYKAGETVEVVYARANDGEYVEQTVEITLSDVSVIKQ